jgi:hypothetical protein
MGERTGRLERSTKATIPLEVVLQRMKRRAATQAYHAPTAMAAMGVDDRDIIRWQLPSRAVGQSLVAIECTTLGADSSAIRLRRHARPHVCTPFHSQTDKDIHTSALNIFALRPLMLTPRLASAACIAHGVVICKCRRACVLGPVTRYTRIVIDSILFAHGSLHGQHAR